MLKKIRNKESTLRRRLILFFVSVTFCLILAFTFLLTVFGINGSEEKNIQNFFTDELNTISGAVSEDFGLLSVDGIQLAESLARVADDFFDASGTKASDLTTAPELIEPLLSELAGPLLNTVNNRSCGGVFILLDATVNPSAENSDLSKAGIFIKKTQPTSTQAVGVKLHYLRGPAQIARDNDIGLIAQWKMEYHIVGEEFFTTVMETARQNPGTALSRLYYWSGRITLEGNSEAGFLLCVPLRSSDGTVFGVSGIEVSDRMLKSMYSPTAGTYENVFAVVSPSNEQGLTTSLGILAGNYYLTGNRFHEDLMLSGSKNGFERFSKSDITYGGKTISLRLYPNGSPYEKEAWSVALLMPEDLLDAAINGRVTLFIMISILLLVISLAVSVFISKRYLRPVHDALDSIKNRSYEEQRSASYLEINDLFEFLAEKGREHEEFLAEKDRAHQEAIWELNKQTEDVRAQYDMAQTYISHLADERMPEVDTESFDLFMQCLHSLTPKEREIFNLYLEGKQAKDILEIANINQNTLKYHNKNIYSKLGVSSRKQLLEYAALMKYTKNA